jgi:uncharacterized protein (TIRG00374 family)
VKLWIKALISLVLLAVLIWQVDLQQLFAAVLATQLELSLAAFLFFLAQQVVVAWAWQIPLAANGGAAPFMKTLEVHFVGSFFGTFLPSSVSMDIFRAYRLGRYTQRGVDSASAMFATRVIGFLVNFLLALIVAIPVSRTLHNMSIFWLVLSTTIAFVFALWLMLNARAIGVMKQLLVRFKLARVADKLGMFRESILALGRTRRVLINLIVISFLYQIGGIFIVYVLGRALSVEMELWRYFIYIPLIAAISVLPISLAGIGIREGAFVFFLSQAGVPQAQALSLSLMLYAQTLAMALLGGVWYFFAREQRSSVNMPFLNAASPSKENLAEKL